MPFTYIEYDSNARLWPGVRQAYDLVDRYQLVNSYGLFRRMTGVGGRPEVVIEGSSDGVTWTVGGEKTVHSSTACQMFTAPSISFWPSRRLSSCTSQGTWPRLLPWWLHISPDLTGKCGLQPWGLILSPRGSPAWYTDCCKEKKTVGERWELQFLFSCKQKNANRTSLFYLSEFNIDVSKLKTANQAFSISYQWYLKKDASFLNLLIHWRRFISTWNASLLSLFLY